MTSKDIDIRLLENRSEIDLQSTQEVNKEYNQMTVGKEDV